MKNNVFAFWYGKLNDSVDKNIKLVVDNFSNDFNFELWPSQKQHEFLVNNSRFYNEAFKRSDFVFMSDYFRSYAIYTYGGVYFDANTQINFDNFKKRYKNKNLDGVDLYYSSWDVTTSYFAGSKGNLFNKCVIDLYDAWDFDKFDYKKVSCPIIFTFITKKIKIKIDYFPQKDKKFNIFTFRGQASWKTTKSNKPYKIKYFWIKGLILNLIFWKPTRFLLSPLYFLFPKRMKEVFNFTFWAEKKIKIWLKEN